MKKLGVFLLLLLLILACSTTLRGDAIPTPPPPGVNLVLYPSATPTVLHLHGLGGDVHIWIAGTGIPPTGASAPLTKRDRDEAAALEKMEADRKAALEKIRAKGQ